MIAQIELPALFLSWLARSSVQACVLIGVVLAVQAVLPDKLAPRWRYALWLLVVIRLALPWAPEATFSVYNLMPYSRTDSSVADAPTINEDLIARAPNPAMHLGSAEDITLGTPLEARPELTLAQFLPLIWLLGAMTVVTCALTQSLALAAALRRRPRLTDRETLDLLEDCKQQMGVRRHLALLETPRVKSPALFGCIRPCLLLPSGGAAVLGRDRLRHVFLHELAHLKRHDIAVNWVMTVLQALHWFNPLVWYAFYRARTDREMACDALVLSRARDKRSSDYGRTMVYLLEQFSSGHPLSGLAGILEDKTQIERRMKMIVRFKAFSGWWSALAVVLIVVLGTVALTNAKQTSPTSGIDAEAAKSIDAIREGRPWIPKTTTLDAEDHLNDKVDYPFVTDPDVLGTWKVVDFVREKDRFVPGKQWWGGKLDFLKEMRFDKDGTVAARFKDRVLGKLGAKWTKGMVLHEHTAPKYEIMKTGGNTYLFYQWKSGDYTIRYMKPGYYVLRKLGKEAKSIDAIRKNRPWIPKTTTLDAKGHLKDKVDYPFVADADVVGTWNVVDFVGEKDRFVSGKQQWAGKLDFLKALRFHKDGTLAARLGARDWAKSAKWTKGMVLTDDTAPNYEIMKAGGNTYLFYQWKSGDYTIRCMKPGYYVLQKEP